MPHRVRVIDSHTEGEPTRVVLDGLPDLGTGPLAERLERLCGEFDAYRRAVLLEPRGHEAIVGAALVEPTREDCHAGVLFFNNVGPLGMCGHGTIGLVQTLAFLGRIQEGTVRIETPVGVVTAELGERGMVTIGNVPSFRLLRAVALDVEGYGEVVGDVAWGGNWFFLAPSPVPIEPSRIAELTRLSQAIRQAMTSQGITGTDRAEVDHVELFGPSPVADVRNFVLCPGGAYDRSPCGTGTSAKLACLYADGKIMDGEPVQVESVIGGLFTGSIRSVAGELRPTITGRAFITAEATLLIDDADPLAWGILS